MKDTTGVSPWKLHGEEIVVSKSAVELIQGFHGHC
jgi:hypothetical protein